MGVDDAAQLASNVQYMNTIEREIDLIGKYRIVRPSSDAMDWGSHRLRAS